MPQNSHPYSEYDTVEEAWTAQLNDAIDRPSLATQIVADLQSHHTLTTGTADDDTIRQLVADAIDELPLGEYGVDANRQDDLRQQLKAILDLGLEGDLEGPVAAMTPDGRTDTPDQPLTQAQSDPTPAATADPMAVGAIASLGDIDDGAASTADDATELLAVLIRQTDLTLSDFATAVRNLDRNQD